ncbi:MAG: hypothetical protein Q7T71_20795 [Herbiconiux sp.]|nr:hypothetical protein [Herbiconiux sp.]
MAHHYRRAASAPSDASNPGPSNPGPSNPGASNSLGEADPYAAYLGWLAAGRPSMSGGGAVRPEAGTVLLADHVQVQLQTLDPGLSALPADRAATGSAPLGLWSRLTAALRRRAR